MNKDYSDYCEKTEGNVEESNFERYHCTPKNNYSGTLRADFVPRSYHFKKKTVLIITSIDT